MSQINQARLELYQVRNLLQAATENIDKALEAMTYKEHTKHSAPTANPMTAALRDQIRGALNDAVPYLEIAKTYNVNPGTVSMVLYGKFDHLK